MTAEVMQPPQDIEQQQQPPQQMDIVTDESNDDIKPITMKTLSFSTDLRHSYTSITSRLMKGSKSLHGILELLRLRIDAETQFTNSLKKIIGRSDKLMSNFVPEESLRKDGLEALCSDLRNEYTQRVAYLTSLKEDIQKPLRSTNDLYSSQNKLFANQTKNNIKALKQQQNEYNKLKTKYDKTSNFDEYKLLKKKMENQQIKLKEQRVKFNEEMTSTLVAMEECELKRMNSVRDGLTNWSAFITNLCANRVYDVRDLGESMSLIDIENDLQMFMQTTLENKKKSESAKSNGNGTESTNIRKKKKSASEADRMNVDVTKQISVSDSNITQKRSSMSFSFIRKRPSISVSFDDVFAKQPPPLSHSVTASGSISLPNDQTHSNINV